MDVLADSALFRLSYGLYVVTVHENGAGDNGCVINTAMQVNDDPARVMVALNRSHCTQEMLRRSGEMTLSVLSTEAEFPLYQRFGFQSGREADKFAGFSAVRRAQNGCYYLTEGCNAFMSATVEERWDIGSHTLFLARVGESGLLSGAPSATYAYYREQVKPAPPAAGQKQGGFVCRVCGYHYPGETLPPDFICPICGHGASEFEAVS